MNDFIDIYEEEIPEHFHTPPEEPTIVYVKMNNKNEIVKINSSAFIKDTTGWIEIDRGYGYNYRLAENNYLDKPLMNEDGSYNYRLVNGVVRSN